MKTLIVSKTHMKQGMCIGGLTKCFNNIRLLQQDGNNQPLNAVYEIGQVYDIDFLQKPEVFPPHTEDVLVQNVRYIYKVDIVDVLNKLRNRITLWNGSPYNLYDNLIQFTVAGSGYISNEKGVPDKSVGFWVSDCDLACITEDNKIRYKVGNFDIFIKYVGSDTAIEVIPKGTLLRVSLARWWSPEIARSELRCYLQLSGWYL